MDISSMLENVVSLTIVAGFAWAILRYLIKGEMQASREALHEELHKRSEEAVKFNAVLDRLERSIDKLSGVIERMDDRQRKLEGEFGKLEQAVKALHGRVDDTEKSIKTFARFCYETHKKDSLDCTPVIDVMNGIGGRGSHEDNA